MQNIANPRLPDKLQNLTAVLEVGGKELREEVGPPEWLPVLGGLVALADHLEDELCGR